MLSWFPGMISIFCVLYLENYIYFVCSNSSLNYLFYVLMFLFRSYTPLLNYLITSMVLWLKSPGTWEWHGIGSRGGKNGTTWYILVFCYFKYSILKMNSFLGLLASTMILTGTPHFLSIRIYAVWYCSQ